FRITGTLAPALPVTGAMVVSVGAGALMVKTTALLAPAAVVAVTFLGPTAALAAITKVALICVAVVLVTVTVTPAMALRVAPVRFVPVRTTGTVTPSLPATGAMLVSVGADELTVKSTALLEPPSVVTDTLRGPAAA